MSSTDKYIFFCNAIKERREISAHIFNDVFIEFEEKFYKGKPYINTMKNFKKHMKIAAESRGFAIAVLPVYQDRLIHGIRNLWSVKYNNK